MEHGNGGLGDIWLVRHGETEWARLGRHTGRTDIQLTPLGRQQAEGLRQLLAGHSFELVLTSPLLRASETAKLAGFPDAIADEDLQEWDYGEFEGRTTDEINDDRPGWRIWSGPWPGGETPDDVGRRADRVISRARTAEGDTLLFGHGHLLRVLAARWLDLPASDGAMLALRTSTISVLGWERDRRVIDRWNVEGPGGET